MDEQWYSNKELFEMLQNLKGELQQTRADLRKYNDLRGAIAELQKNQIDQAEEFRKHMFEPDGLLCAVKKEVVGLSDHFRQDIVEINKKIDDQESRSKGRMAVAEGFIRWGGWVIGLLSFAITVYKLLA
jgi:phage I-like protein